MLIEQFAMHKIDMISINTDGVVIHYPESKQDIVDKIHTEWEGKTNFVLEDTYYKQIAFASVNAYLAEIVDDAGKTVKVKLKGAAFDIEPDYHKNNSQCVVSIALREYFIHGVPIKEVIRNIGYEYTNDKGDVKHTTIYDYCIGRKKTGQCEYYSLVNGIAEPVVGKVLRYYISDTENKLLKKYTGGKKVGEYQHVNKGFGVTMFMDHFESTDYNINYAFYEEECMKIIRPMEIGTRRMENPFAEQIETF